LWGLKKSTKSQKKKRDRSGRGSFEKGDAWETKGPGQRPSLGEVRHQKRSRGTGKKITKEKLAKTKRLPLKLEKGKGEGAVGRRKDVQLYKGGKRLWLREKNRWRKVCDRTVGMLGLP